MCRQLLRAEFEFYGLIAEGWGKLFQCVSNDHDERGWGLLSLAEVNRKVGRGKILPMLHPDQGASKFELELWTSMHILDFVKICICVTFWVPKV